MEAGVYAVEAKVEATHWWFVGRRRLFGREIRRLKLTPGASALDVGTGTGANLRLLRDLGLRSTGLDASDDAVRFCKEKGFEEVRIGDAAFLPFHAESFDLVLATDVIEHLDNDHAALAEIARVLRPDGAALITVPAFQFLWGPQDELAHHKRRYRLEQLSAVMAGAGLRVQRIYYFNYLLLLPILFARRALKLFRVKLRSENELNSPLMNAILSGIFTIDVLSSPAIRPPAGVSVLAVARRASE